MERKRCRVGKGPVPGQGIAQRGNASTWRRGHLRIASPGTHSPKPHGATLDGSISIAEVVSEVKGVRIY